MSTTSGALPIERTYLRKVWLAFAAIALALAIAVVIALVAAQPTGSRTPQPQPVQDVDRQFNQDTGPFNVNGNLCHQCL